MVVNKQSIKAKNIKKTNNPVKRERERDRERERERERNRERVWRSHAQRSNAPEVSPWGCAMARNLHHAQSCPSLGPLLESHATHQDAQYLCAEE